MPEGPATLAPVQSRAATQPGAVGALPSSSPRRRGPTDVCVGLPPRLKMTRVPACRRMMRLRMTLDDQRFALFAPACGLRSPAFAGMTICWSRRCAAVGRKIEDLDDQRFALFAPACGLRSPAFAGMTICWRRRFRGGWAED